MNIYDTKIVRCTICNKCIGEIRFDAKINSAKCGQCNRPQFKPQTNMIYIKDTKLITVI